MPDTLRESGIGFQRGCAVDFMQHALKIGVTLTQIGLREQRVVDLGHALGRQAIAIKIQHQLVVADELHSCTPEGPLV